MWWRATVFGFLVALASPISAQEDGDVGEQVICLAFARYWAGTREELLRIREDPVPITFRGPFEGGGCPRFNLVEDSLLAWHFAYGDEDTATRAIDYLERQSLPKPLEGSTVQATLHEAWDTAWPALQRREALADSGDNDARFALSRRDASLRRIDTLTATIEQHRFIADSWIRAARFHSSGAMLERAAPHMEVIRAFGAFLRAVEEQQAQIERTRIEPFPDYNVEEGLLEARYITSRALLLGELDALPPANRPRPDDAELELEEIFANGIHIQELSNLNDNYSEAVARIEGQTNWEHFVVLRWREEVLGDLARDMHRIYQGYDSGVRTFDDPPSQRRACASRGMHKALNGLAALELDGYSANELRGYPRHLSGRSARDDRIALMLAEAACHRRVSANAVDVGDFDSALDALGRAMYVLSTVRQLVQPDESPGRFRQIVEMYLDTADRCREMSIDRSGRRGHCTGAFDPQLAAYFEANLNALDWIAYGKDDIAAE